MENIKSITFNNSVLQKFIENRGLKHNFNKNNVGTNVICMYCFQFFLHRLFKNY